MSSNNEVQNADSAYTKLESMIRRFSRDKMGLQEKISSTHQQVALREKDIEEKNQQIKSLTLENDELKSLREEDEKSRFAVEATVTSSEKKIHLLVETICSYDEKAQDLRSIHKMYEDFNDTLKRRHLILNGLWNDEVAKNRELTNSFQQDMKQKHLALATLQDHCTELTDNLNKATTEKGELEEQYLELVSEKNKMEAELNSKLSQAVDLEEKLSLELSKIKVELQERQHRLDVLSEEMKTLLAAKESADKLYMELKDEKINMESEFQNQLSTLSVNADNLKNELSQKTSEFTDLQKRFDETSESLRSSLVQKDEVDKLYMELKDEKAKVDSELSASKEAVETIKVELDQQSACHQQRLDVLREEMATLLAAKESSDKFCMELKDEKINMESEFKNQLSTLSENAEKLKHELSQKTSEFTDLKERFDQTSESLTSSLAQKDEVDKLYMELKDEKAKVDSELSTSNEAVELMKAELNKMVASQQQLTDDLNKTTAEKGVLEEHYVELVSEKNKMEVELNAKLAQGVELEEKLSLELSQSKVELQEHLHRLDILGEEAKILLAAKESVDKLYMELMHEKTNMESEFQVQLSTLSDNAEMLKNQLGQKTSEFAELLERFDKTNESLESLKSSLDQKGEVDKLYMELKDEKAKVDSELSTSKEAVDLSKTELNQKTADLQKVQKRLNELMQNVKTLTRERDVLNKHVAELTKGKETRDSQIETLLDTGNKWKTDYMKKAKALKALQTEYDNLEKQHQEFKKSTMTNSTQSQPTQKLSHPDKGRRASAPVSAPKASKCKPFRRSLSGMNNYTPSKGILRPSLDTSLERKNVSFCSPVQHTWSSTPDSSEESDSNEVLSDVETSLSELKVSSQSQNSEPGQKRGNGTMDMETQSPAGKKTKTDETPGTPGTPSSETQRKFFRRTNRSPMTSAQASFVPTTPRPRLSFSQN